MLLFEGRNPDYLICFLNARFNGLTSPAGRCASRSVDMSESSTRWVQCWSLPVTKAWLGVLQNERVSQKQIKVVSEILFAEDGQKRKKRMYGLKLTQRVF
jgi:hypothetical protein